MEPRRVNKERWRVQKPSPNAHIWNETKEKIFKNSNSNFKLKILTYKIKYWKIISLLRCYTIRVDYQHMSQVNAHRESRYWKPKLMRKKIFN